MFAGATTVRAQGQWGWRLDGGRGHKGQLKGKRVKGQVVRLLGVRLAMLVK